MWWGKVREASGGMILQPRAAHGGKLRLYKERRRAEQRSGSEDRREDERAVMLVVLHCGAGRDCMAAQGSSMVSSTGSVDRLPVSAWPWLGSRKSGGETHEAAASSETLKAVLSKVPEVALGFWIIKIAATTVGETGGDALSMPRH